MCRRERPRLVLAVVFAGFFVTLLDTSIVNVALPRMRQDLHAGLDEVLWVVNGYLLALAVPMITAGRLGDRFGPKRIYLAGLGLFTAASALSGVAPGIVPLVAARVLAGVGAAMLGPQTLAFIAILFPPARRGAALGLWGSVAALATATGPLAGGVIVDLLGWRWIFLVNVPVGLLALVLAAVVAPDPRPGERRRFDVPGTVLIWLALLALSFGLLEGQRYRWGRVAGPLSVPASLALGVVLLGVFVALQRVEAREPLVPLRLFRNRNFAAACGVMFCFGFAMAGLALPLTLYLQTALGLRPSEAGTVLAVASLASGAVAPCAARLTAVAGRKLPLLLGLAAYALGLTLTARHVGAGAGAWPLVPPLLLAGIGIGCVFMLVAELAVGDVEPSLAGAASGVFNTTRQVGGVLGAASVGALLQNRVDAATDHGEPMREAVAGAVRQTTVLPVAVTILAFVGVAVLLREARPRRHSWPVGRSTVDSDKSGVLLDRDNALRR